MMPNSNISSRWPIVALPGSSIVIRNPAAIIASILERLGCKCHMIVSSDYWAYKLDKIYPLVSIPVPKDARGEFDVIFAIVVENTSVRCKPIAGKITITVAVPVAED